MSLLQMSLVIPTTPESISYANTLSGGSALFQSLTTKLSKLSLTTRTSTPLRTTPIRMGGGPRTFPGGVSKWQWKRMQAKKSKQLLKARLARERQIYEMRKRAELKAAVTELERPWETVEKPPNLFSVTADEQLKVLADRFQKPGGFDLWSERDGPELFRPGTELPSSRFFPKGVVHSVKPYGSIQERSTECEEFDGSGLEQVSGRALIGGSGGKMGSQRKGEYKNSRSSNSGSEKVGNVRPFEARSLEGVRKEQDSVSLKGKFRKKESSRTNSNNGEEYSKNHGRNRRGGGADGDNLRSNRYKKAEVPNSEVFDMSLQNDGTYGFELKS